MGEKNRAGAADSKTGSSPEKGKALRTGLKRLRRREWMDWPLSL